YFAIPAPHFALITVLLFSIALHISPKRVQWWRCAIIVVWGMIVPTLHLYSYRVRAYRWSRYLLGDESARWTSFETDRAVLGFILSLSSAIVVLAVSGSRRLSLAWIGLSFIGWGLSW